MKFHMLGQTGLNVSVLGFGASSLGAAFRAVDETEAILAVQVALDLGMNLIDVSPYYGLTKAEKLLGKALRGVKRDRYILATKVGRYGRWMRDFNFSAKRVTASVDESLRRLSVDHVDLIQCHDIEFGDLNQVVDETLPALQRVVQSGKARFIGITGLPLKVFRSVLDRVPRGSVNTILSYCRCCLNDTALEEQLPYLVEQGVGVINASPLAMGLLSNRGTPDWHPASEEVRRCCSLAAEHCRKAGSDIAKLAVQFAVSRPGIATTLVGSADHHHIQKNVACIDEPIDQKLLAEVLDILAPIHNQTWPSGRPENN